MSGIRVLHLRASNFYGGPERQLHLHALQAKSSEMELHIASFSERHQSPEFLKVIEADGIPIHLVEVTSAYDRGAIGKLRDLLNRSGISILCTHDYRSHLIGWLAARGSAVRWIAFSRGFTQDNWKVRLYHGIEKFIIRFADRVVAVSESQAEKLRQLRVAPEKIVVVRNAIDPEAFQSIERLSLRKRFTLPADSIVGFACGRFSAEKGQADLIRATAIASARAPRLRLIMAGNGPEFERCRELITRHHLEQIVFMPGFERDAVAYLKDADFLVNPSLSEGLPNVILEAMAVGVPVIATNVGGVPELLTDNESGLLVPPSDPMSLATAILRLVDNLDLRGRLAATASQVLSTGFSFEQQCGALHDLYRETHGHA
ncbi:MAG: glycosyltransferase family 4 protein [candidate division Zixibacteria bacterium]|nr:glycosyltransferase family 4 protein [candidate division Zixibacteria bacterium]